MAWLPGPPYRGPQRTHELQEALSRAVQQDKALHEKAAELLQAGQRQGGHMGGTPPAPTHLQLLFKQHPPAVRKGGQCYWGHLSRSRWGHRRAKEGKLMRET